MNDAYKWIEEHTKQTCSPLGRTVATILSKMGSGGIYNRPVSWGNVDWSDDLVIEVNWGGSLSNWDFCDMTALWGWAAELMVRVEISPSSPRHIKLRFWQRSTRTGGMGERLPNAADMLAFIGLAPSVNDTEGEG